MSGEFVVEDLGSSLLSEPDFGLYRSNVTITLHEAQVEGHSCKKRLIVLSMEIDLYA
jgi:hypothetical protein